MRTLLALLLASSLAAALCGNVGRLSPVNASAASTPQLDNPDAVCASCHQAIYDRYERTPMALGSGLARNALQPGQFHHAPSNIDYRVFSRDGAAWMSFSRPTASGAPLEGERQLLSFIGSGHRGRTYLYQQDGQWFELPINFYTRRNAWDMAPAFDAATSMPAALPVDPNCLHCHATQVQPSLPEARNRFAAAPFLQGGIGCSACHGDPARHLAQQGRGPILNPANLTPAKRDSACIQCHLEGEAVVYRPGRSLAQFRPGEDLAGTAVYFVRASQQAGGARATSQYEALLRSACKRASGDRLTCTTCHDPHSSPTPAERVQFFRAKCLACHTGEKIAAHHPEQPDCAHCHMPTRDSSDISHEQVTDHDIEARPNLRLANLLQSDELIPVGGVQASEAEYGQAYAQLAANGDTKNQQRALTLLTQAAASGPLDPPAEVQLGFLQQLANRPPQAREAYLAVLHQNPYDPVALANLGVLDASSGRLPEAVHVLDRLIQADPSQTPAGLNLAFIQCKLGHPKEALAILQRLRQINPDDPQLRAFLHSGSYAGQHCDLPPGN
jgi:predicted CXXCH cytochrome family protein